MGSVKDYFSSLGSGIASLLKGMQVTGKEFITPKITEQYPENRDTVKVPDRFRAVLELKYDSEGRHKCIACGICERNCPNGTISLTTKMVDTPDGKKKRKLDTYSYDLGSCTFCQLCVTSCPQDALEFSNDFEQAVFTREKLVRKLGRQDTFVLQGEPFKKRKAVPSDLLSPWYNMKGGFSMSCERPHDELLFSPALKDHILERWELLVPLFRYLSTLDGDPDPREQ